ncbi:hypothetical protein BDZ90DRAFT_234644 [Jaminaea rosea]|uniref:Uncharacterized protein n=1 Tax=Jaminaea rosea TaxID=1569628 RepID=A0A316UII7_9BASI|nr:hypothetical protein BDZ90DRAFT_234644 [Jaminaea rosea]PWN24678.1 hypothetical protein BDZ90DRAFT_234644 [Jaminaea rosea]
MRYHPFPNPQSSTSCPSRAHRKRWCSFPDPEWVPTIQRGSWDSFPAQKAHDIPPITRRAFQTHVRHLQTFPDRRRGAQLLSKPSTSTSNSIKPPNRIFVPFPDPEEGIRRLPSPEVDARATNTTLQAYRPFPDPE